MANSNQAENIRLHELMKLTRVELQRSRETILKEILPELLSTRQKKRILSAAFAAAGAIIIPLAAYQMRGNIGYEISYGMTARANEECLSRAKTSQIPIAESDIKLCAEINYKEQVDDWKGAAIEKGLYTGTLSLAFFFIGAGIAISARRDTKQANFLEGKCQEAQDLIQERCSVIYRLITPKVGIDNSRIY